MAEQAGNSDLILENREKLTVTGVRRVLQCNAESAAIETARGVLQLAGAQLNVTSLDLDSGEVKLTGRIDTVVYAGQRLSLRLWGRTASAACPAGTGTGAVLAGGGAAPAGPAGIAAAGSSPQKTGGAGQSAPHAKKKRKKTEKELAKHTAVVV